MEFSTIVLLLLPVSGFISGFFLVKMSVQHLRSESNSFSRYQNVNFLPPPAASHLSLATFGVMSKRRDTETVPPQMGFHISSHSMDQKGRQWSIQQVENRGTKRPHDGSDGIFGVQKKDLSLDIGEEEEPKSCATGKNGHTKLCARGHWRPAEDAKLKDLVAQYGPQNWNLIAENLEGRSGKQPPLSKSKRKKTIMKSG